MKPSVLIVDDEEMSRFILREALTKRGYAVEEAPDAEAGLRKLRQHAYDLVLLDVQMPGLSGIDAIPKFKDIDPSVIIIMTTALGSKEMIMDAISRGALDYFVKPFKMEEMEVIVKRSLERRRLEVELQNLKEQISETFRYENIVGRSGAIQDVLRLVGRVASTTATVLIWGETGTGKELIARAIHQNSSRKNKPMVKLNCAGIPEGLLESELFGFEKGAFTGAVERKLGKFELADQGTIFLDEIGDMNPGAQAKILRILQEMEFERLGGIKPIKIDVRVIAATNRDLTETVKQGMFREDLFHRLNLFSIRMPALRNRIEDIPLLAEHFLKEATAKFERPIRSISGEAMSYLMKYEWPGNVRELKNTIERSVLITDGDVLTSAFLPTHITKRVSDQSPANAPALEMDLATTLKNVERQLIQGALERADGVQRKAAKLLGVTERVLWYKIKKLQIDVGNAPAPEGMDDAGVEEELN
jgi:two-component system response regulator AtoC